MNAIYQRAELQYGTLSRSQALECGLTVPALEYLVKQGRLQPVFPSVYRVLGAPQTGRQRAMAATLWLGEESAISH